MGVEFKKAPKEEVEKLKRALDRNAAEGTPLNMDPLTTGWQPGEDEAEAMINAIKSVPVHYAEQWVVVRQLLGDEIADLGEEVEVFGPYTDRDSAKVKRQELIERCKLESGICIVKLRS